MRFIKPDNIAGEICTLIKEADRELVIISPYCNFKDWSKLEKAFQFALNKKVELEFYIRKGEIKTEMEVKRLNIEPLQIENLHAKIYFNENHAIVTSMNLVFYSDQNSLDFAYVTTTTDEYDEIIEFYERHILGRVKLNEGRVLVDKEYFEWQEELERSITNACNRKFRIVSDDDGEIVIQGTNRYIAKISKKQESSVLNICGILSKKQFDRLINDPQLWSSQITYKLQAASKNTSEYNTIWFNGIEPLKTEWITSIVMTEAESIKEQISIFIGAVEGYKNDKTKQN